MIQSFVFSEGKLIARDLELEALRLVGADKGLIVWVDLNDPTDAEIKSILEGVFQFHPLAIEDCVTPSSLPKVEDYETYLFIVTHAVDFSRSDKFTSTELDLFLGKEFLVTFHRKPLKSVQATIDRVTKSTGVIARGPDRLAHNVLDQLVDNYQPAIMELGSEVEQIEETMIATESKQEFISEIIQVRGDVSRLRSIVRPQRELIDRIARGDSKLIRPLMLPYFRDLRDNLARIEEAAVSYHDRLLLAFDIHLNKAAFQTNEGIKFLTALTAVTIPVMTVGTWYGMNFENMPEVRSGYPWAIGITLVITILTVIYLKKRKWF